MLIEHFHLQTEQIQDRLRIHKPSQGVKLVITKFPFLQHLVRALGPAVEGPKLGIIPAELL